MSKNIFFVYGTLKEGGFFAKRFNEYRVSVKKAIAEGQMYSVYNNYPAVVFNKKEKIYGEIHEYNTKEVEKNLDKIEGYYGKEAAENLFNKIEITVTDMEGKKVKCKAYEFNRSVTDFFKIKSGIWKI
jgi:gamma-glutamylcyclotransferase (GGCT)/AIG2-like uncharacterized protein YtfP